jgi:hypothetical protein
MRSWTGSRSSYPSTLAIAQLLLASLLLFPFRLTPGIDFDYRVREV